MAQMGTMMADKADRSCQMIERLLEDYRRPAVLWSGGKDSMVLLHLLREMGLRLPVIRHAHPRASAKDQWCHELARKWNLEVYDWAPAQVYWQKVNGRLEPVQVYAHGARALELPLNWEHNPEGLCGVWDFIERPRGSLAGGWDLLFHGHKNSDVDLARGPMPLAVDVLHQPGYPAVAYPLREWTDADVAEYSARHAVPQQETRYALKKTDNGWRFEENPDHELNPDWQAGCAQCLDPDSPKAVWCPRLECEVPNLSATWTRREPTRMEYLEVAKGQGHGAIANSQEPIANHAGHEGI